MDTFYEENQQLREFALSRCVSDEESCSIEELQDYPPLCMATMEFKEDYLDGLKSKNPNFDLFRVASGWHIASLLSNLEGEISQYLPEYDSQRVSFLIEQIESNIDQHAHSDVDPLFWDYRKIIEEHVPDAKLIKACLYVLDYAQQFTHEC